MPSSETMKSSRWKRVEAAYAKRLGGARIPVTGRQGPHRMSCDISSPYPLWVDVKSRKSCPKGVWKWLENVASNAPPDKIPLLILHQPGSQYDHGVVVMRFQDFITLVRRAYEPSYTTTATKPTERDLREP